MCNRKNQGLICIGFLKKSIAKDRKRILRSFFILRGEKSVILKIVNLLPPKKEYSQEKAPVIYYDKGYRMLQ